MTVYFISRHQGATDWLHRHGVVVDAHIEHLPSTDVLRPGDRIYGTLPINLVAEACARGTRYWHLVFPQSRDERGHARSADEMDQAGVTFVEYVAYEADADAPSAPAAQ